MIENTPRGGALTPAERDKRREALLSAKSESMQLMEARLLEEDIKALEDSGALYDASSPVAIRHQQRLNSDTSETSDTFSVILDVEGKPVELGFSGRLGFLEIDEHGEQRSIEIPDTLLTKCIDDLLKYYALRLSATHRDYAPALEFDREVSILLAKSLRKIYAVVESEVRFNQHPLEEIISEAEQQARAEVIQKQSVRFADDVSPETLRELQRTPPDRELAIQSFNELYEKLASTTQDRGVSEGGAKAAPIPKIGLRVSVSGSLGK